MSKTYRAEKRVAGPKGLPPGAKMRRCEMCDELYPADEMYPVYSASGYKIGVVCETCSADMELIEEVSDGVGGPEDDDL